MPYDRRRSRPQISKILALLAIACAAVVVAVPSVSASPSAQKILVLSSLCNGSTANDYLGALDTNPSVSSWDSIDIQTGSTAATPSAAQLAPYDGVVALNDCTWSDANALGDALADFQDAGGVVIAPSWTAWDPAVDANYAIGGRWATGGYSPFVANQNYPETAATGMVYDGSNPIFTGVGDLANVYTYAATPAPGAILLGNWNTGSPAVVIKGQALALNGWLGDHAGTSGNYAQLTVNAIKELGPQGISVSRSGNGSGTVISSRGGIDCGTICSATVPAGALVKFTPTPAKGSTFAGWDGGCGGASTCELAAPYPWITGVARFWYAPIAKFSLTDIKIGGFKKGTLSVTVPGDGQLVATSSRTKRAKKTVAAAGKVKLKLKLTSKAKKILAKKGSLKVTLKLTFTPTGATVGSKSHKSVKFKK